MFGFGPKTKLSHYKPRVFCKKKSAMSQNRTKKQRGFQSKFPEFKK